jgi:hypothetical protein
MIPDHQSNPQGRQFLDDMRINSSEPGGLTLTMEKMVPLSISIPEDICYGQRVSDKNDTQLQGCHCLRRSMLTKEGSQKRIKSPNHPLPSLHPVPS